MNIEMWLLVFADVVKHVFMILVFFGLLIPFFMYCAGYDYTYMVFWRMFQVYKIRYKNREYVRNDLLRNQMMEICEIPDVRVDKCDTFLRILIIFHWPLRFRRYEHVVKCHEILEDNYKDIIALFDKNTRFNSKLFSEIIENHYSKKHGDLEFRPDSGDEVFKHILQADIIRTKFINSKYEGGKYNELSNEEIEDVFMQLLHARLKNANTLRGGFRLAGGIFYKCLLSGYISMLPSEQMLKKEFGEELKCSFEAVRKGFNESSAKLCTVIDSNEYSFPSKEKVKL